MLEKFGTWKMGDFSLLNRVHSEITRVVYVNRVLLVGGCCFSELIGAVMMDGASFFGVNERERAHRGSVNICNNCALLLLDCSCRTVN